ncbi:IS110 family transposase [Glycomyces tenuis]|uniref:IS110 family transposase n=1 Tax=Glycomyces tenuis TaxID=58116 RepID=UPI00040B65B2|nr:IS110 family transposase [Glycomyces tenuis]
MDRIDQAWAGIDVGKTRHHVAVVDTDGRILHSKPFANDETAIIEAVSEARSFAAELVWAVDITGTAARLLLALLAAEDQHVVYVPGRTVHRMTGAFAGDAKTDARDAFVIAETARLRRDLTEVEIPAQLVADLGMLTERRRDIAAERIRAINQLRDLLSGVFPTLERALDLAGSRAGLVLLTGFQTPAAIRRRGLKRLGAWLNRHGIRIDAAERLATKAVEAARAQRTVLPGEDVAAELVADLAEAVLGYDERIVRLDRRIREVFETHPQSTIITSLPGMGPILGAEFIAAAGDLSSFADAGHLASAAGLAPVPRDSGRRTGNLHRPKRYSRKLRRVCYMSAQASIVAQGPSRDYYLKKRAEGCRHVQALIALARRRIDVLWALLRDNRLFTPDPPGLKA